MAFRPFAGITRIRFKGLSALVAEISGRNRPPLGVEDQCAAIIAQPQQVMPADSG
jgi:hypothetical protein